MTLELLLAILGFIGGGVFLAVVGYWFKQYGDMHSVVGTHGKKITRLEDTAVNEDKVRALVTESNKPLLEMMASFRTEMATNTQLMHNVLQELAHQKGYEQAKREAEEKLRNGSN